MLRKILLGSVSLIITVLLAQESPASLLLILNDISTPGADVVVLDDLASGAVSDTGSWTSTIGDTSSDAGQVQFNGSVGSFNVNVTTGLSSPTIGNNTLQLNSVSVSGAPGTLELWLIDTDFVDNTWTFNTQFGGTTTGAVSFASFVDADNREGSFDSEYVYAPGVALEYEAPYASDGVFSFNESADNIVAGDDSFSLALGVLIEHDDAGDVTGFSARLSQVPEPGALAVWSVLAMGMLLPKRRRKSNVIR